MLAKFEVGCGVLYVVYSRRSVYPPNDLYNKFNPEYLTGRKKYVPPPVGFQVITVMQVCSACA